MDQTGDFQELFINQELGRLEFQRRLFGQARNQSNPLLERVKFISILGSLLDEFFMVRVGGLKAFDASRPVDYSLDGFSLNALLAEIRRVVTALLNDIHDYWRETLLPELHQAGIHILDYDQLNPDQKAVVDGYFNDVIFPVLTPLANDTEHPFPHISNLSLNLAILVEGPNGVGRFARVKVPQTLPYLVPVRLPSETEPVLENGQKAFTFVWISQVINANLGELFPGLRVMEAHPFHVTRNAELDQTIPQGEDLLEAMEENIKRRRFGAVVRLMVHREMPLRTVDVLTDNLELAADSVYIVRGPLVLRDLSQLCKLDRPDLKYPAFTPRMPLNLADRCGSIFDAIRQRDILFHHPYDSFMPVIDFLKAAACDPDVLAIKQTLYRVGNNSPVVQTLLEACRDYGKQVAVMVELKARFDEESNIGWAKLLEQEGVHVTFGIPGLKTHSKIALVIRKEGDHIRRYIHLATGNYNHVTATLYEDFGLLTCDPEIGADATDLFNYLTGYSLKRDYRKLLVAPVNMRSRLQAMIQREIDFQRQGIPGHIILKTNSLVDRPIIDLLYKASQAGVRVDLIVRGACSLRPGIPGISDNIRVISIVGRFLEHSRIYCFHNGGKEEVYLGSADIMPRNLNQRVEILFPIQDPAQVRYICDEVLGLYLSDNSRAHLMQPDGSYRCLAPRDGEAEIMAQEIFMKQAAGGSWD